MNIETIIAQLKTYVPPLGGRISGAADFAAGLESVANLPLPAGFVLALDDETTDNDSWPGLFQSVTERIGVVVEFDNTTGSDADARTGFAGADQVYPMRGHIFSALLSWIPTDQVGRAARGLSYGGGRMLTFDRARLFWQFEFTLDTTITDADGFPISGDPLIDVQGTIAPAPAPVTPIIFDALNT